METRNHHSDIMKGINTIGEMNEMLQSHANSALDELRIDIINTLEKQAKFTARRDGALVDVAIKLAAMVDKKNELDQNQKLLQSLTFESIKHREEAIKNAHKTTLEWAFKNPDIEFMRWLREETGLYWVKGKAS
jgi:hypothetical protein